MSGDFVFISLGKQNTFQASALKKDYFMDSQHLVFPWEN